MKQTAVEWLAKELESYGDSQIFKITWEDLDSLVNQAKEMEKKQIINVVEYYCADTGEAELYYKETFKSE